MNQNPVGPQLSLVNQCHHFRYAEKTALLRTLSVQHSTFTFLIVTFMEKKVFRNTAQLHIMLRSLQFGSWLQKETNNNYFKS